MNDLNLGATLVTEPTTASARTSTSPSTPPHRRAGDEDGGLRLQRDADVAAVADRARRDDIGDEHAFELALDAGDVERVGFTPAPTLMARNWVV